MSREERQNVKKNMKIVDNHDKIHTHPEKSTFTKGRATFMIIIMIITTFIIIFRCSELSFISLM